MITIRNNSGERQIPFEEGKTLLQLFQNHGITEVHSPCGGKGTCQKCWVALIEEDKEVQVLSCLTKAVDNTIVVLKSESGEVIASTGESNHYAPDPNQKGYAIACDIGTTSVVCHLVDLKNGQRLGTESSHNAQSIYGADVISRIKSSNEGKLASITKAIVDQVNQMMKALCQKTSVELSEICQLVIVGNTVMEHFFAGLDPQGIGVTPFTPESLFGDMWDARELGLIFDGQVYLANCVAGYVGGDITSDILAVEMEQSRDLILLIDIGTNGEMALGNQDGILSCATAAGPAFEGAEITMGMPAREGAISKVTLDKEHQKILVKTIGDKPSIGICGSGLLDAIAVMLEIEAIDETGCFAEEGDLEEAYNSFLIEEEVGMVFYLDENVKITQADVRKIQLAKAAIAAGIQTLVEKAGKDMSEIKKLLLAGGFGSFLDPVSAAKIGLIPEELLSVTKSVGNAAGEGAVSLAVSTQAREELTKIQELTSYIELSNSAEFNDYYIECMYFE